VAHVKNNTSRIVAFFVGPVVFVCRHPCGSAARAARAIDGASWPRAQIGACADSALSKNLPFVKRGNALKVILDEA
jgi:hypothetical protein